MTGGVFGICGKGDCAEPLYIGTANLQHRGEECCGISMMNGNDLNTIVGHGLFRNRFRNILPTLQVSSGIGHTSTLEVQPFQIPDTDVAICFDGFVTNASRLQDELTDHQERFDLEQQIQLIGAIIRQSTDPVDGIRDALKAIEGPCCLLALTREGVIVARDALGKKPLIFGEGEDCWGVASESCAFQEKTRVTRTNDVGPGGISIIDNQGIHIIDNPNQGPRKYCQFEYFYFARPDSVIYGQSVVLVRMKSGRLVAQMIQPQVEFVSPIPNSGIYFAKGLHHESGIPYLDIFLVPRHYYRTYQITESDKRMGEKEQKLTPLEPLIRGKTFMLADDSIRSGITIKELIEMLIKVFGAIGIHLAISTPPSKQNCPYNRPPKDGHEEYIAINHAVDEIKSQIGALSLTYQELENIPGIVGLPECDLCMDCYYGAS